MKFDLFYIIGLLLALFVEVLPPIMPVHTPELAAVFFLASMATGKKIIFGRAYCKWMAVVFGFFALSMLWARNTWNCYWGLRQMFVVYIGMLATFYFLSRSPENIKTILKVYLVESVVLFFFILTNLGQIEAGARLDSQLNDNLSNDDVVYNANVIGINLCYALYAVFVLFYHGRKKSKLIRLGVLLSSIFVVYLILMTGSRKSLVLLLLPFIIRPLLGKGIGKKVLLIPITAGVVSVMFILVMNVPILYDVIGTRVEDMINIISGTTVGGEDISRALLIEYGIGWFLQNPLLGYGINNFRVLSDNTWMFAGQHFYAHNNYVELLVDVGLVGFLIYYSCFYYFWKNLKGHFADNTFNKWIAILIIAYLFLDIAMVSYYNFSSNLIICLCFYATEITRNNNVKYTNNYEAS